LTLKVQAFEMELIPVS